VYLKDFKLNIDSIVDSKIGDIGPIIILKELIKLFEGALKGFLNLLFIRGWSIKWILEKLGIGFITFEKSELKPFDGYFIFYVSPLFNIGNNHMV
jgi:hypothetical protein